jgi:ABC-type multidrug transport system fused ATPase/permease subunit
MPLLEESQGKQDVARMMGAKTRIWIIETPSDMGTRAFYFFLVAFVGIIWSWNYRILCELSVSKSTKTLLVSSFIFRSIAQSFCFLLFALIIRSCGSNSGSKWTIEKHGLILRNFSQSRKTIFFVKIAAFAIQSITCLTESVVIALSDSSSSAPLQTVFVFLTSHLPFHLLDAFMYDTRTNQLGELVVNVHKHPLLYAESNETDSKQCHLCDEKIGKNKFLGCEKCNLQFCIECYDAHKTDQTHSAPKEISQLAILIKCFKLLSHHIISLLSCIFLSLLCQIGYLVGPVYHGKVVDSLVTRNTETLQVSLFYYVSLHICLSLAKSVHTGISRWTSESYDLYLKRKVFDAIVRQETQFFDATPSRVLVKHMSKDLEDLKIASKDVLESLIVNISRISGSLAMCLLTDWRLTVIAFNSLSFVWFFSSTLQEVTKDLSYKLEKSLKHAELRCSETLLNFKTVRSFGAEISQKLSYFQSIDAGSALIWKYSFFETVTQLLVNETESFLNVLILLFGGINVMRDQATIGDLVAFQIYWGILQESFMAVRSDWTRLNSFTKEGSSIRKIFEILESVPSIKQDVGTKLLPTEKIVVKIESVSFSYEHGRTKAIEDISLQLLPGTVTALVGRSGSGKSTISQLLLRLYDPDSGKITFNGQDIRDFKPINLRQLIGVVAQNTELFEGSIRDNLIFGATGSIPNEEIFDACKLANAHEFILGLLNGYDTQTGEKGCPLSGGQKQRLSFARCLLRKPKILLLDEATSSLDLDNEMFVTETIEKLRATTDCAILLIAHRLSTVRKANNIVVLEKGRLIEQGNHKQLLAKKNGLYATLIERQTKMNEDKIDRLHI